MKKLYTTVKNWNRWNTDQQEKILKKYDVILTDHTKRTLRGIMLALLRPTPQQKASQKRALESGIAKLKTGIDHFDAALDDLSAGLRDATGSRGNDPVRAVFGDRKPGDLHKAVFGR